MDMVNGRVASDEMFQEGTERVRGSMWRKADRRNRSVKL
jgi:hypothetical protein